MNKVITLQDTNNQVLLNKTNIVDCKQAKETIAKLNECLHTLFASGPVAGLAANQIGIDHSVFAFSPNRTFANLEFAVNPTCEPVGSDLTTSWEMCLSCKYKDRSSHAAEISRHSNILVSYLDHNWNKVQKELTGFAAKVFQHEWDHLQGIVNINRPDAQTKFFHNQSEAEDFMTHIRANDAKKY